MEEDKNIKGIVTILLASIILSITIALTNTEIVLSAIASFLIIISVNVLAKKTVGNMFEIDVKHKFWSVYQWGFRKDSHFKNPIPMIWFPPLLAIISSGVIWWLAILEFDVAPKTERVSRRHGLYRFTQVTEWHMAVIAVWGIIATVLVSIIGYFAGYELFAKVGIYYSMWSLLPFSSLDGSKILFGSRALWIILFAAMIILTGFAVTIPF